MIPIYPPVLIREGGGYNNKQTKTTVVLFYVNPAVLLKVLLHAFTQKLTTFNPYPVTEFVLLVQFCSTCCLKEGLSMN